MGGGSSNERIQKPVEWAQRGRAVLQYSRKARESIVTCVRAMPICMLIAYACTLRAGRTVISNVLDAAVCDLCCGQSVSQSVLHGEGSCKPSASATTHVRAGGSRVSIQRAKNVLSDRPKTTPGIRLPPSAHPPVLRARAVRLGLVWRHVRSCDLRTLLHMGSPPDAAAVPGVTSV